MTGPPREEGARTCREESAPRHRRPALDAVLWALLALGVLVYAWGTVLRPAPQESVLLYVVVYNGVFLAAAALCWRTRVARRREVRAARLVAGALLTSVAANATTRWSWCRWTPRRTRRRRTCST